jgi:hypothetical protein
MQCANHPSAEARWDCARCETLHCDGCVRRVGTGARWLGACAHCDGVLRALQIETVPAVGDHLRDLLVRPLSPPGLTAALTVAIFAALSDIPWPIVDLTFGLVALIALSGTWFNAVDHIARGKRGFPAPVEADGWSTRTQATRGLLCLLVLTTPFGLWLGANRGAEGLMELLGTRPVTGGLIALVALAWLTAALLAVLVSVSGLGAFWPPALVAVVSRAPHLYLRLLAQVVVTSAVVLLISRLTGHTPYLSSFLTAALGSLVLFAQAALVGGFVFRHRAVYSVR